ncbi:hypothetical protein [Nostoc sp. JL33]|nr:hypothetical protein [Nostoc sp. JL33]
MGAERQELRLTSGCSEPAARAAEPRIQELMPPGTSEVRHYHQRCLRRA